MAASDFASLTGAMRLATKEDIAYLRKNRPFLEVVGITMDEESDASNTSEHAVLSQAIDDGLLGTPALIELKSGWVVHFWPKTSEYPPAMTVSSADMLGGNKADISKPPLANGTVSTFAFDAAAQMVLIALTKSWQGIQIVNGDSLMQWALWAVAEKNNLPCYGYDPTGGDQAKADRVAEIIDQHYTHNLGKTPTPKPHQSSTDADTDEDKD